MATGAEQFAQYFNDEVIEEQPKLDENGNPIIPEGDAGGDGAGEGDDADKSKGEGDVDGQGDADKGGEDEEEVTLFHQLNQDFGFEFEDELAEDYEGIKAYVTKASEELSKRNLEDLFTRYPAMAEMFDFVMNGGTEQQYFNLRKEAVDYATLEIKDNDEITQERVLRLKLAEDGYDEDEIKEKIEAYKSAAILKEEAKSALKLLNKRQALKKTEELAAVQKEAEEQERKYEEFVQSTQGAITKGVLKNVQIPEKDKKAFQEFIFKPVDKSGKSARDIAREKMSLEERLELEYLVFKGMKLGDLITAKKETKNLSHLRKDADKEQAQAGRNAQSAKKLNTSGIPEGTKFSDYF